MAIEKEIKPEPTWELLPIEIMVHNNHECAYCGKLIQHDTYAIKDHRNFSHLECWEKMRKNDRS